MISSSYHSQGSLKTRKSSKSSGRAILSVFLAAFFVVTSFSTAFFSGQQQNTVKAGPEDWIICDIIGGEVAEAWQFLMSDDHNFYLESKSSFGLAASEVDSYWVNQMISLGGDDFKTTNETILGRELYQPGVTEPRPKASADAEEQQFNSGPKVSPYDRFGLAGLTFTGYLGEWKYIQVDVCNGGDPTDPKAGMFYDERLPPQSTWSGRENSVDMRAQQHLRSIVVDSFVAILNTVANWTFNISKFMVAITLAFINFAFGDVTGTLGVDEIIAGNGTKQGIFQNLFEGLFKPLVAIAFVLTGLHIFWTGAVKRQYRQALTTLLRSLFMFLLAFVIAGSPTFWLKLPNNIAIMGQAILVSTMSGTIAGGNGLCATDIGMPTEVDVKDGATDRVDATAQQSYLDSVVTNMRSNIGCSMWQQFLLKPWTQGQFGRDWNELWAAGKTPSWAPAGSKSLDNGEKNRQMVGEAAVPIGGDEFIYNWAVYQISTQTNAHSPTNHDGEFGKWTSGINNDWWRIVDAVSNYQEKEITISLDTGDEVEGFIPADQGGSKVWPAVNRAVQDSTTGGLNISGDSGSPVYAAQSGTISEGSSSSREFGNTVTLKTIDGTEIRYGHLTNVRVTIGQEVEGGQVIGAIGTTGSDETPFLHFEVKQGEWGDVGNREVTRNWLSGSIDSTANGSEPNVATLSVPDEDFPPLEVWGAWVGNDVFARLVTAFTAIFVTFIGVLAPLVFAFLCAIYAIGIAILVAFAPIMLLLGCWAGKGWEIFKGWGELLINTMIKRMVMGLMLVLSLIFTSMAIKFMETTNWWTGILLMALISAILIKNRKKMINGVAAVKFANHSMSETASRLSGGLKKSTVDVGGNAARIGGLATVGAVAGGVSAHRSGAGFKDAMKSAKSGAAGGARSELRNLSYRNRTLRNTMMTHDTIKQHAGGGVIADQGFCVNCGDKIDTYGSAYRNEDGNWVCQECGDQLQSEGQELAEVQIMSDEERYDVEVLEDLTPDEVVDSSYTEQAPRAQVTEFVRESKSSLSPDPETVMDSAGDIAAFIEDDIRKVKEANAAGKDPRPPEMPAHLRPYMDSNLLKRAWDMNEHDMIREMYLYATIQWAMVLYGQAFVEFVNKDLESTLNIGRMKMDARKVYISTVVISPSDGELIVPEYEDLENDETSKD